MTHFYTLNWIISALQDVLIALEFVYLKIIGRSILYSSFLGHLINLSVNPSDLLY
jgi:hypothetical protein